jgi:hypothetical protein
MLKPAIAYKDKLQKEYVNIIYEDKYKFWNFGVYWGTGFKLSEDTWNSMEFVSVNKNDEVIGYLKACIDRSADKVEALSAVNFGKMNPVFSKDFREFLHSMFDKFNFRKVEFSMVVGNPAEAMYDKYINKYGGRIVGIQTESTRIQGGKYCDVKLYEIMREDYLNTVRRIKSCKATTIQE